MNVSRGQVAKALVRPFVIVEVEVVAQAGKVLPSMLLQKLGTHNRRNKLYRVFTEVGRVIRTIFLLEFLSSMELRQQVRGATTLVERYNSFLDWLSFGAMGSSGRETPLNRRNTSSI